MLRVKALTFIPLLPDPVNAGVGKLTVTECNDLTPLMREALGVFFYAQSRRK